MGETRSRDEILKDARLLHALWRQGALGGASMPEDAHPPLPADSEALARYFTLGMALNYQRDSYALWRACTATFLDTETAWVFDLAIVANTPLADLARALAKHRVALQPRRHPQIWRDNSTAFVEHPEGSVRAFFSAQDFDIARIRAAIVGAGKSFPYLRGPKIVNYWLFVMSQYMAWPLTSQAALSIAPDRHVIEASVRLGLTAAPGPPDLVAALWREVLNGSGFDPIDLHTPLWLWGRSGFPPLSQLTAKPSAAKVS